MSRWRLWWKAFYSIPSLSLLLGSLLMAAWLDNAGIAMAGFLANLLLIDRLARQPGLQRELQEEWETEQVDRAWAQVNAEVSRLRLEGIGEESRQRLRGIWLTSSEIVKAYKAARERQLYTPLVQEALDAVQVYYRLVEKRIKLAQVLRNTAGARGEGLRHLEREVADLTERLAERRHGGHPDHVASLERQLSLRQMELETYRRYLRHLEEIDLRLEETRALLESVRARVALADMGQLEETSQACHELLGEMNALDQAMEQLGELRRVRL